MTNPNPRSRRTTRPGSATTTTTTTTAPAAPATPVDDDLAALFAGLPAGATISITAPGGTPPQPAAAPTAPAAPVVNTHMTPDDIADLVAQRGTEVYRTMVHNHRQAAINDGAAGMAVVMAHTGNRVNGPIQFDPAAIAAAVGLPATPAAATTETPAAPATTTQVHTQQQTETRPTLWKNPVWAILAAVCAIVVALIAMSTFLSDPKGDGDFANKAGFWWLVAIAAGAGAAWLAWSLTKPTPRPHRMREVRHTYELQQTPQGTQPSPAQPQPAPAAPLAPPAAPAPVAPAPATHP